MALRGTVGATAAHKNRLYTQCAVYHEGRSLITSRSGSTSHSCETHTNIREYDAPRAAPINSVHEHRHRRADDAPAAFRISPVCPVGGETLCAHCMLNAMTSASFRGAIGESDRDGGAPASRRAVAVFPRSTASVVSPIIDRYAFISVMADPCLAVYAGFSASGSPYLVPLLTDYRTRIAPEDVIGASGVPPVQTTRYGHRLPDKGDATSHVLLALPQQQHRQRPHYVLLSSLITGRKRALVCGPSRPRPTWSRSVRRRRP